MSSSDQQPLINRIDDPESTAGDKDREQPAFRLSKLAKYCLLLEFLLELSNNILTVPLITLFEQAICETYYRQHDQAFSPAVLPADELSCKISPVQSELARLRGWKAFFETLSALLVAIPVGHLADRLSHRKVFAVILAGMVAALAWTVLIATHSKLPLRLVWLTSVCYLCGGGFYAAEMMTSIMIAAACSARHRTRTFYYAYAAFISTELIGPPLASITSRGSLWTPIALGFATILSCYVVLAFMPEPRTYHEPRKEQEADPECDPSTSASEERSQMDEESDTNGKYFIFVLLKEWNMKLALPIFFIGVFRGITLRVLLPYTSVKFGWRLAQTNWIISEVALVNLVLFFLVLPTLVTLLHSYTLLSTQEINLQIVRHSLMILVLGSVLLAVAPSLSTLLLSVAFYATGYGARATLLSLVTEWLPQKLRGRLYSTILVVEQCGMLVGDPVLQSIFASAVNFGKSWFGLPFLFSSACYLIAFVSSLGINIKVNGV